MDKLLLTVRPSFIFMLKFVIGIAYALFYIIALFVVLFVAFFPEVLPFKPAFYFYILCAVLADIVIVSAKLLSDYLNYKATTYKVYDDRIEFEEGFINHKYTTLKWVDIKEIHFTQNFLQCIFGIGHIKFITAANTGYNGYNDGIKFRDIQNPKDIYDQLKKVHNGVNN